MNKVIFFFILLFSVIFPSCVQYFTAAPPLNLEKTKKLLNGADLTGLYQSAENSEFFENNDFEKYVNPSLGTSALDTFEYLFGGKKSSEFIEVSHDEDTYFLRYFGAFNKTIVDRFSKQWKRPLLVGDDSISLTIQIQQDSMIYDWVRFKKADKEELRKAKKQKNPAWIPSDTINKRLRIWTEGSLLCFTTGQSDYSDLPDTLSYSSDKRNFYLTSNENDLYLVQKVTLEKSERVFSIARFVPSESMFVLSLMNECDQADSCSKILNKHKIQLNQKQQIVYNEKVLTTIFSNSEIRKLDLKFNKIRNYKKPIQVKKEDQKLEGNPILNLNLLIGASVAVVGLAYFLFRRKKK
jgi:hypothetical protein